MLSVCLSPLLALAVTACATGGPAGPAAPAQPPPQQQPAPTPQPTQPASPDPLQTLYEEAKREGEVQLWGGISPTDLEPLTKAFNQRFPGITVKHFEIRPDDFVPRVLTEAKQGRVSLDVGAGRLVALSPLIERNLVQRHTDWTTLFKDLNPGAVTEDGRMLTFYNLTYVLSYNTQLVKPDEVPRTWQDLLDPKWKGRIIVEPRGNAFAYLGLEWGEQPLLDYLARLKAQQPVFVKGGTAVGQQLASGVAPLGIGAYGYQILQLKASGAPVDWAKSVSPIGTSSTSLFAMAGAPHPKAAKLFAGWLASEEAQSINTAHNYYGTVAPGSSYPHARELEANQVKVVLETNANFQQASALNQAVVKALGAMQ